MAKCIYCHQKKGKRGCPSLSGTICSFCCGKHRQREIDCHPTCPFLSDQQLYYVQKNEKDFKEYMVDLYKRAYKVNKQVGLSFAGFIDAQLCRYFYDKADVTDMEVVSFLELFRNMLSPIKLVIPYESSALSRAIYEEVADYMDEIGLDKEDALSIVDSFINHIKGYADNKPGSNRYIKQLVNLVETKSPEMCRAIKDSRTRRSGIILPFGDLEADKDEGDDRLEKGKIILS